MLDQKTKDQIKALDDAALAAVIANADPNSKSRFIRESLEYAKDEGRARRERRIRERMWSSAARFDLGQGWKGSLVKFNDSTEELRLTRPDGKEFLLYNEQVKTLRRLMA